MDNKFIFIVRYINYDYISDEIVTTDLVKALDCWFKGRGNKLIIWEDGEKEEYDWLEFYNIPNDIIKQVKEIQYIELKQQLLNYLSIKQNEYEVKTRLENQNKEEQIRNKELAELDRLRAKYENG